MRIERNQPLTPAAYLAKSDKARSSAPGSTVSDLNESQRLDEVLANTAEVRADQVAHAKALIFNPNYPSAQQLEKVADLLAAKWQRES